MKAIIMAGGKGTRLQPLTSNIPKPMVPLLDKPCMEYIIELLKRHGITDIAVTVEYLPQVIRNYFGDGSEYGVNLQYFVEMTPLGTAGSVKNTGEFIDGTFVVISGDALTDYNLTEAIQFHKQNQAMATLVLAQVENPTQYGVVMTREDGRIVQFQEKPAWNEALSNMVNTGIYVFEPDILESFNNDREFDFGKDLFPYLLKGNIPLYGYVASGYWSDIGSLVQYRESQLDMLNGLVNVAIQGRQIVPQVWVGNNVQLHQSAKIEGPAYVGQGSVIGPGVSVGPGTVIGRYNRIDKGCCVGQTVTWNRVAINKSAYIAGTVLCNDVWIGAAVKTGENTIIGDKTRVGEKSVIDAGVKIWPKKFIEADTIMRSSLIWGKSVSSRLFGSHGIRGIGNIDITPEFVSRAALAYGSSLAPGSVICVSTDECNFSQVLKYAVISSLLSTGINVQDAGVLLVPMARYACQNLEVDGGMHIQQAGHGASSEIVIQIYDHAGNPIHKSLERKIENVYFQEDFHRPDIPNIGQQKNALNISSDDLQQIISQVDTSAQHRSGDMGTVTISVE